MAQLPNKNEDPPHVVESVPSDDQSSLDSKGRSDDKRIADDPVPPTAPALAERENERMEAVLGDAILRFLRIRKGPRGEQYDLDAVSGDYNKPHSRSVPGPF